MYCNLNLWHLLQYYKMMIYQFLYLLFSPWIHFMISIFIAVTSFYIISEEITIPLLLTSNSVALPRFSHNVIFIQYGEDCLWYDIITYMWLRFLFQFPFIKVSVVFIVIFESFWENLLHLRQFFSGWHLQVIDN